MRSCGHRDHAWHVQALWPASREPNATCDVHTSLTLSTQGGARAKLSEALDGTCELYVAPQAREYRLRLDGSSCGSKIYKGKTRVGGKTREITITDHRTRFCRDLVPAKIIVDETDVTTGTSGTKYSFDGQSHGVLMPTW